MPPHPASADSEALAAVRHGPERGDAGEPDLWIVGGAALLREQQGGAFALDLAAKRICVVLSSVPLHLETSRCASDACVRTGGQAKRMQYMATLVAHTIWAVAE
jgi:hypothetical protein